MLWNFIIAGIVAIVIGGGLFGMVHSHDNKVRAAQKSEDVAAISACQANQKVATDAVEKLTEDVARIGKERDDQTTKVKEFKKEADDANERSRSLEYRLAGQMQATAAARRDAESIAMRPVDKSLTCVALLAKIGADAPTWLPDRDKRLREIREVLGLPAVAPAPEPKQPGGLRIGK